MSDEQINMLDPAPVEGTVPDVAQAQEPEITRPDYLPEQYWDATEKRANIQGMAEDLKKFRTALSRNSQDVPKDAAGYALDGTNLPDALKTEVQNFAHSLGLTTHQAEELFGESADKLDQAFEKYYAAEDAAADAAKEKEYREREVAEFGGAEKINEAIKHMDNMFIAAKNKGLMDDSEIAAFKHSAIRDAKTLKTFDKLVDFFDTLLGKSTINTAAAGHQATTGYSDLSRDELVSDVVTKLRKARTQDERDRLYKSLSNL